MYGGRGGGKKNNIFLIENCPYMYTVGGEGEFMAHVWNKMNE